MYKKLAIKEHVLSYFYLFNYKNHRIFIIGFYNKYLSENCQQNEIYRQNSVLRFTYIVV